MKTSSKSRRADRLRYGQNLRNLYRAPASQTPSEGLEESLRGMAEAEGTTREDVLSRLYGAGTRRRTSGDPGEMSISVPTPRWDIGGLDVGVLVNSDLVNVEMRILANRYLMESARAAEIANGRRRRPYPTDLWAWLGGVGPAPEPVESDEPPRVLHRPTRSVFGGSVVVVAHKGSVTTVIGSAKAESDDSKEKP